MKQSATQNNGYTAKKNANTKEARNANTLKVKKKTHNED